MPISLTQTDYLAIRSSKTNIFTRIRNYQHFNQIVQTKSIATWSTSFLVADLKEIIKYININKNGSTLHYSGNKKRLITDLIYRISGSLPTGNGVALPARRGSNNNVVRRVVPQAIKIPPVNEYLKSAEWFDNGDPYHKLMETIKDGVVYCTGRGKQSRFVFNITNDIITKCKRKGNVITLRAFTAPGKKHVEFTNASFNVTCNTGVVPLPAHDYSGRKGQRMISPIELTSKIRETNNQVTIVPKSDFVGFIVVSYEVNVKVEDIVKGMTERSCTVCQKKSPLQRCSKCKIRYYCSREHQHKDWLNHKGFCNRHCSYLETKKIGNKRKRDDEFEEGDSLVSLTDPISLARIEVPIRGYKCTHITCLDLKTFMAFSESQNVWKCTLCAKSLPFDEVLIDEKLLAILKKYPESVLKVRMSADGTHSAYDEKKEREKKVRKLNRKSAVSGGQEKKIVTEIVEMIDDDNTPSTSTVTTPTRNTTPVVNTTPSRSNSNAPSNSNDSVGSQDDPICL